MIALYTGMYTYLFAIMPNRLAQMCVIVGSAIAEHNIKWN